MLNISNGKVKRALKVCLYGPEGIGKSTLASQFPDALFIDTEGGTSHMDVKRIEGLTNWDDLMQAVTELLFEKDICKTLVLDTADWAEQMCVESVCAKFKKNGIEEFGYGKGYTYLGEEFARLLNALDDLIAAGINVVITAHAKMRKFEQPDEMGAYDRWEMKLSKQVAPILKEWCDELLFLNYKTFVVSTESGAKKGQGGKRVMYATHHPCWDAKNRHGLPDEMDMDFENLASLFGAAKMVKTPLEQLKEMMAEADISEADIRKIVASKKKYDESVPMAKYPDEFISNWIIKNFSSIVKIINKNNGGNE